MISPSVETVVYASSAFRSCSRKASYAPTKKVARPKTIRIGDQPGAAPKIGSSRPSRKMPAFTIVAACR